jgi:hypothetical protein
LVAACEVKIAVPDDFPLANPELWFEARLLLDFKLGHGVGAVVVGHVPFFSNVSNIRMAFASIPMVNLRDWITR